MLPTLSRPPAPFSARMDRRTFTELGRDEAWGGLALLCRLGRCLQGRTGTGPGQEGWPLAAAPGDNRPQRGRCPRRPSAHSRTAQHQCNPSKLPEGRNKSSCRQLVGSAS